MLRRVCFIIMKNRYDVVRAFTRQLMEALEEEGVQTFSIDTGEATALSADDLQWIYNLDVDLTASFSDILPFDDGRYLWDLLEIPHLSILTDPVTWFISLAKSRYSILACVDRNDVKMLEKIGSKRTLFFPHAVDRHLLERPIDLPREYDVTFLGTCFDYESIEEMWKEKETPEHYRLIMGVIEQFKTGEKHYLPHLVLAVAEELGIDKETLNIRDLCYRIDHYLRGWDRVQLLKAAAKEHEVHLFGGHIEYYPMHLGWEHYLKGVKNLHFHPQVDYSATFELMAKSRVTLNTSPFFYDGSHERVFNGLALGCSLVTTTNTYLEEEFGEGKGVAYYRLGEWEVASLIERELRNEEERLARVMEGRHLVEQRHTWNVRARQLIEAFPDLYCHVFTGDDLSLQV